MSARQETRILWLITWATSMTSAAAWSASDQEVFALPWLAIAVVAACAVMSNGPGRDKP